jgi:hypothetical protein
VITLVLADPASLTAIALGASALTGAGSLAAQLFSSGPKAPAMPAPTPPANTPVGTPSSNKGGVGGQSFLAAAAAAPGAQQQSGKTLLGQ